MCGGHDQAPRGKGVRCFGYTKGGWVFCTREEYAGKAEFRHRASAYVHRLEGACPCGIEHAPMPPRASRQQRKIDAVYSYLDEDGRLLYEAVRFRPKGFAYRRRDGVGEYVWNLDGVRRVPYRLSELLNTADVFVAEGEKDVDRLVALGLTATCNPGGAGKWDPAYDQYFGGKGVTVIPDNDEEGRRHAYQVAASLYGTAAAVMVLELPDLPPKGDVSDWLDAGGTRERLLELALQVPEYQPSAEPSTNGVKPRLTVTDKITTNVLADIIIEGNTFAIDQGEKLYRYQDGVYRSDGVRFVRQQVKKIMVGAGAESSWSSHRAEETVKYIGADAPILWDQPPTDIINVADGLLDISDLDNPTLLPHTSDYLSAVQLPATYNPEADCPRVKAFCADIWPEDAVDVFFELFGVATVPNLGKDKAILLIGSGGNGRSTYLRLLREFVGGQYCSAMSLQRIEDNRFAIARAVGKLINISPDLPAKHLETSSTFKAWTGGDTLTAEYKHRDAFEFTPYARLLFSANYYPKSSDATSAFFDRWIVLEFNKVFRGASTEIAQDKLVAEMTTTEELSGLLNEALAGLKRFQQRGNRYLVSPTMKAAWTEFKDATDPLSVWLDAAIVVDSGIFTTKDDLLRAYNSACRANGRPEMNRTSFGRALRQIRSDLFNDATEAQRTVAEKLQRCWIGVGLKSTETEGKARRVKFGL